MHADHRSYLHLTGPRRVEKALSSLQGLLAGVGVGPLPDRELQFLNDWMAEHSDVAELHPFVEVFPALRVALADGTLDAEEIADLDWLCSRILGERSNFQSGTNDIQALHGLLGGIAADGEVTDGEADALAAWLDEHEYLRTVWPYDEVATLLTWALRDRVIDLHERQALIAFFSEFTRTSEHRTITPLEVELGGEIFGLCAVQPEVIFPSRTFAFTGASTRGTRSKLEALVMELGGVVSGVGASLDYLIVGANGNPAWAYSCYGRKVEKVMHLRRDRGARTLIVYESDFWDAVAIASGDVPAGESSMGPVSDLLLEDDGMAESPDPKMSEVARLSESTHLRSLLANFAQTMRERGWHVELDEARCSLHRRFANGKPRKGVVASLVYSAGNTDGNGRWVPNTERSRPYTVRGRGAPKAFKDLPKAVATFVAESLSLPAEPSSEAVRSPKAHKSTSRMEPDSNAQLGLLPAEKPSLGVVPRSPPATPLLGASESVRPTRDSVLPVDEATTVPTHPRGVKLAVVALLLLLAGTTALLMVGTF